MPGQWHAEAGSFAGRGCGGARQSPRPQHARGLRGVVPGKAESLARGGLAAVRWSRERAVVVARRGGVHNTPWSWCDSHGVVAHSRSSRAEGQWRLVASRGRLVVIGSSSFFSGSRSDATHREQRAACRQRPIIILRWLVWEAACRQQKVAHRAQRASHCRQPVVILCWLSSKAQYPQPPRKHTCNHSAPALAPTPPYDVIEPASASPGSCH